MLKTTLLAAAALLAVGATAAYAGYDAGKDRGYRDHGSYNDNYEHGHRGKGYRGDDWDHNWRSRHHGYGPSWFNYRGRPYCRYEPRRVPIKVWDRRGHSYRKWVWKEVKVCA